MQVIRGESRESPSGLVTGLSEKLNELEQAVVRQAERFTAVLDIGTQISAARDVDALLRLVMDRLTALLGAEASTLFMVDEEASELWSRKLLTASIDAPASRRSFAAVWRRTCNPVGASPAALR